MIQELIKRMRTVGIFTARKSTAELIQEIHTSFYSEVDQLIKQANVQRSLETDKQALIDKAKELKGLGFFNTNLICRLSGNLKFLI